MIIIMIVFFIATLVPRRRPLIVIIIAFINLFFVGNLESIPGSVQCEFAAL